MLELGTELPRRRNDSGARVKEWSSRPRSIPAWSRAWRARTTSPRLPRSGERCGAGRNDFARPRRATRACGSSWFANESGAPALSPRSRPHSSSRPAASPFCRRISRRSMHDTSPAAAPGSDSRPGNPRDPIEPGEREAARRPLVPTEKDEGRLAAALVPGSQRWIGRGASCLAAHRKAEDDRRRGMRVPYARLWRFPCGSREHASTRWYLHCRYCWNLSRPDHLLSAVAQMYTEPSGRRQARTASAVAGSALGARIRTTLRCRGVLHEWDARMRGARIAARFGRPRTKQRACGACPGGTGPHFDSGLATSTTTMPSSRTRTGNVSTAMYAGSVSARPVSMSNRAP